MYSFKEVILSFKMENITYPIFTFIRHGQSYHNEKTKLLEGILPPHAKVKQSAEYEALKLSKELLDCSMTPLGISECEQLRKSIDLSKVDLVLVSPLRRALETCDVLFKGSNVRIVVEPWLCERVSAACDIGSRIGESIRDYPFMNFSKLTKNPEGWYTELLSRQVSQKIFKANQNGQGIDNAAFEVLKLHKQIESQHEMIKRIKKTKQVLIRYHQKQKKRVVVIGHGSLIRAISATGVTENDELINGIKLANCEMRDIPIVDETCKQFSNEEIPFCRLG